MARAFWKGVISFGLVAIPVKMSTATESKTPSFHFLHKKCLTRPRQILYVSCKPSTQARDLKHLAESYRIERIQPVDMFPHTFHIENVVDLRLSADRSP